MGEHGLAMGDGLGCPEQLGQHLAGEALARGQAAGGRIGTDNRPDDRIEVEVRDGLFAETAAGGVAAAPWPEQGGAPRGHGWYCSQRCGTCRQDGAPRPPLAAVCDGPRPASASVRPRPPSTQAGKFADRPLKRLAPWRSISISQASSAANAAAACPALRVREP